MACTLHEVGYGRWPAGVRARKLVEALQRSEVDLLIDIRHAPCASNPDPANTYGPRDWHVQATGGIRSLLADGGIDYLWLVELGNPQRLEGTMRVLRAQLADAEFPWPIHRGLDILEEQVRNVDKRCCVMCACAAYADCHRRLIAEALERRLPGLRIAPVV